MSYPSQLPAAHPSLHPTAAALRSERRDALRDRQAAAIAGIEAAVAEIEDIALHLIPSADGTDLMAADVEMTERRAVALRSALAIVRSAIALDEFPGAPLPVRKAA